MKTKKEKILLAAGDCILNFLYYGRKEDEDLPVGAIEEEIRAGNITVEEIVNVFATALREGLKTNV